MTTTTTTTRRGVIGTLLLHRIEVTDAHPHVMLACLGAVLLLGCVLDKVLP